MTADDIRPWVSLFWTVAGPTAATALIAVLARLGVRADTWFKTRVLGEQIANATADQAKMETELQVALGKGFEAATAAIKAHGFSSDAARQAIIAAGTSYFQARFPDRAAQITTAANATTAVGPVTPPFDAVAQTLAARLGNILAVTAQQTPRPQGNPP